MVIPLLGAGRSPHILYRPGEIDDALRRRARRGRGRRGGRRRPSTSSSPTGPSPSTWADRPAGRSCSRARRARARPTWPRPWPPRPACRSCSCRRRRSSPCSTGRPTARSAPTSRRCASTPGGRAGPSASSRRSTPSAAPGGMGGRRHGEGIAGVVNELLIQLQSFDQPPASAAAAGRARSTSSTPGCPPHRHLRQARARPGQHPRHRGDQPGRRPRPALLRPGRFDRSIYFDLPSRAGRREIIDYYLAKKAHDAELDDPAKRETPGRDDLRLLAGDDRAPPRRGAGVGAAPGRRPARRGTTSSRPR